MSLISRLGARSVEGGEVTAVDRRPHGHATAGVVEEDAQGNGQCFAQLGVHQQVGGSEFNNLGIHRVSDTNLNVSTQAS